ncbi:hypothetical protein IL306_001849 [Fusarium sp. DS 682]|nr:hypothetical protein IL306_001849 [Fusarium sp. DS 682]
MTVFWRNVLWAVMKLHQLSPTTIPLGRALVLVDLRDVAVLYAPPFCCATDPTQPLTGVHWVLDTGLGVQEVVNGGVDGLILGVAELHADGTCGLIGAVGAFGVE